MNCLNRGDKKRYSTLFGTKHLLQMANLFLSIVNLLVITATSHIEMLSHSNEAAAPGSSSISVTVSCTATQVLSGTLNHAALYCVWLTGAETPCNMNSWKINWNHNQRCGSVFHSIGLILGVVSQSHRLFGYMWIYMHTCMLSEKHVRAGHS